MRCLPAYVAILLACAPVCSAADDTNMVKLHVEAFTVIGLESRTSNAQEASGQGAIGPLWKQLYTDNVLSKIPNKLDDHIVVVYSDYQSDKDGPYTYLLGAKVSSADNVPPGMAARKIVAGDYATFTSEGAPLPAAIIALWKHIWSLENPSQPQLHRAYKTDFEIYESAAPTNTRVTVYVGLKK